MVLNELTQMPSGITKEDLLQKAINESKLSNLEDVRGALAEGDLAQILKVAVDALSLEDTSHNKEIVEELGDKKYIVLAILAAKNGKLNMHYLRKFAESVDGYSEEDLRVIQASIETYGNGFKAELLSLYVGAMLIGTRFKNQNEKQ